MKKLLSLFLLILCCGQTKAQVKLAVKAGFNNAAAVYKPGNRVIQQSINAFQLGITGELKLSKIILSTGLLFNQKGNFLDDSGIRIDDGYRVTYRLNYLETSVNVGYRFKLAKQAGLTIGAGPYWAIGISGTEKGKWSSISGVYEINRKVHFSNSGKTTESGKYFKSTEFGLNLNATAYYKRYLLYVNFGSGLSNREKSDFSAYSSRNQVFSFGLGYYL